MRTKQVILTFFLFTSLSVFSQNIGFHLGITSANMLDRNEYRTDDENYKSVFGIDAGVDIKVKIRGNFSVLSGLSYYQNGFHEDLRRSGYSGTIEKTIRLNYLKLPVALLFETNPGKNINFGVRTGTYFSHLVSGEFKADDWYREVPVSDAYKDFDWGLTFGGRVNFHDFSVDVGYDLGIKNFAAGKTALISDTVKNRSWNLKLIYFWI